MLVSARRLAAVVGCALAGALLVAPPAAARVQSDASVLFVPSDGGLARTTFVSKPGSRYRVAVTGAYSYNGRQNLADCGWWNPENAGDAWFPGGFLRMNGSPAPCAQQPYTTTHTYTWEQYGTGSLFTFAIHDDGYSGDNLGGLIVVVAEVTAEMEVVGGCDRVVTVESETDRLVGVVVVYAIATGGNHVALSSAECVIEGPSGIVATVRTLPGASVAVGTDAVLLPVAAYRSCVTPVAQWSVGGFVQGETTCAPFFTPPS